MLPLSEIYGLAGWIRDGRSAVAAAVAASWGRPPGGGARHRTAMGWRLLCSNRSAILSRVLGAHRPFGAAEPLRPRRPARASSLIVAMPRALSRSGAGVAK